ncbi:PepSY-associated TM helix domain-containing protein [Microbacterium oleivorans]|uniref:PepSY-associated TM helix domain-containing protein n=1 Tax=Microbacterium oleivorans TaxID=273677 RepID=UPI00203CB706|nr:PepSY-associated TM helix domain-containing protein [Microbacterium oleivorans]MCM3695913.1 PepSY domain-containing protein [Microbacterium oleivorans]
MTATLPAPPPSPPRPASRPGWFGALLVRLHFYAGILVGPFILVAALSGALYAIAPTIEQAVYGRQLHAPVTDTQLTLGEQVEIAEAHVGDAATLSAVRPAPEPGDTTRVMFAQDGLGASESRAVFVDPGTGEIRGDETVYGTSGSLPLRTAISTFHRNLGLGEPGRLYSELAASWLGIVVVAGVILWVMRIRKARAKKDFVRPSRKLTGYRRLFSWHTSVGIWVALGAVFLSATGITWSTYGGQNVTDLRAALDWGTPAVSTSLGAETAQDEHAGHGAASAALAVDSALFDDVLAAAQQVNIDTGLVQITPPAAADQAWKVQEIDRGFPGHLDAVAIDGATLQPVDRVDFADFSLPAKLASWGVSIHMGTMFGLANQIVMLLLAVGIAGMVVLGYAMWVRRRPTKTARVGMPPRRGVLDGAPWWGVAAVVVGGVLLGLALPLVGWTLAAFVVIDVAVDAAQRRRAATH